MLRTLPWADTFPGCLEKYFCLLVRLKQHAWLYENGSLNYIVVVSLSMCFIFMIGQCVCIFCCNPRFSTRWLCDVSGRDCRRCRAVSSVTPGPHVTRVSAPVDGGGAVRSRSPNEPPSQRSSFSSYREPAGCREGGGYRDEPPGRHRRSAASPERQ